MKTYEVLWGERIETAAVRMVALADGSGEMVKAVFNGIELTAAPGSSFEAIVGFYRGECRRRRQVYIDSPECQEAQRRMDEDSCRRARELAEALSTAPEVMTLGDTEGWKKIVEANSDPYGGACVRYADRWARLMEARVKAGDTLEVCAKETSHLADNEGITGFMYGCAVSILAQVWVHGENLRRWHNLDTQIRDEGEKANESGGVLNPALLTIGSE